MRAAIASCLLVLALCVAEGPQTERPVLFIVHSASCPPCRSLSADYNRNAAFRKALQSRFDLRQLDAGRQDQWAIAQSWGVTRIPSFVLQDTNGRRQPPIVGYFGPNDLLSRLSTPVTAPIPTPTPQSSAPSPARSPVPVVPLVDTEARTRIEEISQTQEKLGENLTELHSSMNKSLTRVEGQVEDLKESIEETTDQMARQMQDSHTQARTETRSELNQVRSSIENTLTERLTSISNEISTARPPEKDQSAGSSLFGGLIRTGLTGLLVSFGLPAAGAGLAVTVGSWLIRRWLQRRRTSATTVAVVREDSVSRTTANHYVIKETDRIGEAYKEAIRRVVAAYKSDHPGIVDVARQIEHVVQELLRGQDVDARASQATRPGLWDDN